MKTSVPQAPGKMHKVRPNLADIGGVGDSRGSYRAYKGLSHSPRARKMREHRQKMREEAKRLGLQVKGGALDARLAKVSATQDHYLRSDAGRERAEYLNKITREKAL